VDLDTVAFALPDTTKALSCSAPATFNGKTSTYALSPTRTNCTVSSGARSEKDLPAASLHTVLQWCLHQQLRQYGTVTPFFQPNNWPLLSAFLVNAKLEGL